MIVAAAQGAATAVVLSRLARGRDRRPPLRPGPVPPGTRVSAVVPARDEEARLGGCLIGLARDPGIDEVLVVDDGSRDGTIAVARAAGARVVDAGEPPPGWVGKPWALQRGLEAATGDVVVALDADTRPVPGLAGALVAALADADVVCAGARFVCDTAGERLLHPALLVTLVYRFGPPDASAPARLLANGQCTAVRREPFLADGGYAAAAGHLTDDAALARDLAARGRRVVFRDGGGLVSVDMHASAAETWREWGRSIALPGVLAPAEQAADVATVWLTLGLPPLRALLGRPTRLDRALLALRALMTVGLAGAYRRRGVAYWLSPLADPVAAVRLTLSAVRPARSWRGRTYAGAAGTAPRSAS